MAGSGTAWLKEADMALNQMSWDKTFQAMSRLINARISASTKSTQHVSSPAIWGGERPKKYAYLVVGAGFAGSVMAERLAVGAGKKVRQIGRASCRERGCQYVSSSGIAVSFKKDTKATMSHQQIQLTTEREYSYIS